MSRIFDALQRWSAENSEGDDTSEAATHLLERVEREVTSRPATTVLPEETADAEPASRESASPGNHGQWDPSSRAYSAAEMMSGCDDSDSIFGRCRSVDVSPPGNSHLVCLSDTQTPAAEAFRMLRVRLRHLCRNKPLKKLLITSADPKEGKSFVAANLACILASGGEQRIALVDGDMRCPSLSRTFGLKLTPGISEYLQGEVRLSSCIYRLTAPGIWFLPASSPHPNSEDTIYSTRFQPLLEELSSYFDWIIIDSPPVLPLADASVWARLVDGILLVARRGTTEKRKLERGLEALEPSKLIGAILNSSDTAIEKDYYYYRGRTNAQEKPVDVAH